MGDKTIESLLQAAFWLSAGTVLWTYLGYPLAIGAWAALRPRPIAASVRDSDIVPVPSISIVLAVRNEAPRLERRIENLLDQDVSASIAEIVVITNGSDEATVALAGELATRHPRVKHVASPGEEGKAGALNRGVAIATGEVVVFVDARQICPRGSLRKLLRPFADPEIGAVSGRLVVQNRGVPSVRGVGTYWKLETWLRDSESRSGSVVGCTGAFHAVRRELFWPLPPKLILDDVLIPMNVAMSGHRVVRARDATAHDLPADGTTTEFRRKVRTLTGNLQLVKMVPALLSPGRNPLFFRFASHKMLRLVVPVMLLVMLIAALQLSHPFYQLVAAVQLTFYGLGALGLILPLSILSVPAGFMLLNAAAFVALFKGPGAIDSIWTETRTLGRWPDAEPDATRRGETSRLAVERREAS